MGMLGNQPARNYRKQDYTYWVRELNRIAEAEGISLDQVIEVAKVAEMSRANDIAVSDGDFRDEQMGGFGELLHDLNETLARIAEAAEGAK